MKPWLPYQIIGGKTVKNFQINPKTYDMAETAKCYVVCERGSNTLVERSLSFNES